MDKQDFTASLTSYSVEELDFIAKQAKVEAKAKKANADKQARKDAYIKKLADKKLMTVLKKEEADALKQKLKNERRTIYTGKVKKGDMVSFLLKGKTYLGKVTKATAFGVKVDAASAGILHDYDPEITVDYGFITAVKQTA